MLRLRVRCSPARPHLTSTTHLPSSLLYHRRLASTTNSSTSDSSTTSTGLEVASPLWLYYSLVAQGKVRKDGEQLRALVQLQRLHDELLDYQPPVRLVTLLESLRSLPSASPTSSASSTDATSLSLPAWPFRRSALSSLGAGLSVEEENERRALSLLSDGEKTKQLVKVLKDGEGLEDLETPKGFLLTGPPGTGKSFLMDLFFQSLPVPHKVRFHYHHALLYIYQLVHRALEKQRLANEEEERMMNELYHKGDAKGYPWSRKEEMKARAISKGWQSVFAGGKSAYDPALNTRDFVLAQVALDLIKTQGWLLAFDEVQLVDIAGAGLVSRVLSWYWRLGGVVIGSSNRVPDDLYKQGIQRQTLSPFLAALSHRSPPIHLSSPTDYRRIARSQHPLSASLDATEPGDFGTVEAWKRWGTRSRGWFVKGQDDAEFEEALRWVVGTEQGEGSEKTLRVYGRDVRVPWALGGVARFSFSDLCENRRPLGPADYITLGSEFHTIIIDDVPILPLNLKNEARRLITLLDALYETKTRLLVSAAAPVDSLFFPDAIDVTPRPAETLADDFFDTSSSQPPPPPPSSTSSPSAFTGSQAPGASGPVHMLDPSLLSLPLTAALARAPSKRYEAQDAAGEITDSLVEEMLGDVQQDLEAPYRPNISSYDATSDFRAFDKSHDSARGEELEQRRRELKKRLEQQMRAPVHPSAATPQFKSLAIFTGEEERFAYQRAVSRIYEMSEPEYLVTAVHQPLPSAVRTWEKVVDVPSPSAPSPSSAPRHSIGEKSALPSGEGERLSGVLEPELLRAKWPEGTPRDGREIDVRPEPPVLSSNHVWGMVENWGKRAGEWGRGASKFDGKKE